MCFPPIRLLIHFLHAINTALQVTTYTRLVRRLYDPAFRLLWSLTLVVMTDEYIFQLFN